MEEIGKKIIRERLQHPNARMATWIAELIIAIVEATHMLGEVSSALEEIVLVLKRREE